MQIKQFIFALPVLTCPILSCTLTSAQHFRLEKEIVTEYIIGDKTVHIQLKQLPNFTFRRFIVKPEIEDTKYARISE